MPKSKLQRSPKDEDFGVKLAYFRQAAGYSQRDLARETGISQRMIAYYEKQPQYPPMHVMVILSEALGIPAQEILSLDSKKSTGTLKDMRLRRRLAQIEELEEKEKRQLVQLLDTFIENNRLKQQAVGG